MTQKETKRNLAEWDAEIEADFQRALRTTKAAAAKRKKAEPFVKVPLWWIEETAKITKSPTTLVLIELLRLHWKTKSLTFPLPNGRLQRMGVSRKVKCKVLRELELAGFITVKRRPRKTPIVTLVVL
jgi:hypothetical protein